MAGSPPSQPANLLGALATAVADRLGEELGHPESTSALLSAVDQFLDAPPIDRVANVLGLSQSGTVRLVDRLEREGYVRRGPGPDGRTRALHLTTSGRRVARRLRQRRLALLDDFLVPLDNDERQTFVALAGRLLVGMMREPGATRWTCRLCDLNACGRADGHCPLEQETRRRYG